jgi:hypothetical protein
MGVPVHPSSHLVYTLSHVEMTTADEAHAIAPANPTKLESMITINEISDSKSSQNVELDNNMLEQQPYTGLLVSLCPSSIRMQLTSVVIKS